MAYLDISPMIVSLRTTPDEFEVHRGSLRHNPSGHDFQFDQKGNVRIAANCDCSMLAVRQEQGQQLWQAFNEWQVSYWRPLQINKEFASHFRPRSRVRQWLIDLTARWNRSLVNGGRRSSEPAASLAPAE
jgi:hypothetical protein